MNYQIKLVSEKLNIESEKMVVSKKQLEKIEQHNIKNNRYQVVKIRNTDQKMTYNDLIKWASFKEKIE